MQSVAKVNATKPKNTNKNAEQPQEGWQVLLQCDGAIRKTLFAYDSETEKWKL